MSELPYMPLWIEPLLADTNHLTHAEFGVYVRMLCAMWRLGGSIPDDEVFLRRLLGQGDRRNWPQLRRMLEQFITHEGGRITQKRLQKVRLMQDTKRRHTVAAAMSRWHGDDKPLKSNNGADADASADAHAGAMRSRARAITITKKSSTPLTAERTTLPPSKVGSPRSGDDPPEERASVARDLGIAPPARPPAADKPAEKPAPVPTRMADDWDLEKRIPSRIKPLGETPFLKAYREANGDLTKIPVRPGAPIRPMPADDEALVARTNERFKPNKPPPGTTLPKPPTEDQT